MNITFEFDNDLRGIEVLLARKSRGKISISEIQEAMRDDNRFQGGWWAIVFKTQEESYQGWGDINQPKGDVLELYRVDDLEACPICATVLSVDYCRHCGEQIIEPQERK